MTTYAQLVGTSAVGKGTRTSQLIQFLRHKFGDPEIVFARLEYDKKNRDGSITPMEKTIPLGVKIPELNLIILGKWVKSNKSGLISWTGADFTNTTWNHGATVAMTKLFSDHNYIQEGYVGMFSPAFYPEGLEKIGCEYTKAFYQGYYYDGDKSAMMERIVMRSGRECKGDAAWSQQHLAGIFISAVNDQVGNNPDLKMERVLATMHKHTCPITTFGYNYLGFLGEHDLAEEFLQWSESNTTLRDYRDKESNHNQLLQLMLDQNKAVPDESSIVVYPRRDVEGKWICDYYQ